MKSSVEEIMILEKSFRSADVLHMYTLIYQHCLSILFFEHGQNYEKNRNITKRSLLMSWCVTRLEAPRQIELNFFNTSL